MENELPNNQQQGAVLSFLKNKKVLFWGGALLLSIIVLTTIFLIVSPKNIGQNKTKLTPTPSINLTTPEAAIYFEPKTVNVVPGQEAAVKIFIDTLGREISGASIAIKYNPNVISDVSLLQFRDSTSALSYAFTKAENITPGAGIIELALQMDAATPMQKGKGQVATLTFIPKNSNITMTQISLTEATALITRNPGKVIVLSRPILQINYSSDAEKRYQDQLKIFEKQ